jgi:hypothetical protein
VCFQKIYEATARWYDASTQGRAQHTECKYYKFNSKLSSIYAGQMPKTSPKTMLQKMLKCRADDSIEAKIGRKDSIHSNLSSFAQSFYSEHLKRLLKQLCSLFHRAFRHHATVWADHGEPAGGW